MDRHAIFVDAGYLLAESGKLVCGSGQRKDFTCDYAKMVPALGRLTEKHSRQGLLRIYWYDAARDGIPSLEQLQIGDLRDVKLRLGRLVADKQKGVDSLILRDLMTLARERAVATAYVVSGDEDIREGVVAAQDMGVRVVLIGVRTEVPNQAATLTREADEHYLLDGPFLGRFFTCRQQPPETTGQLAIPIEQSRAEIAVEKGAAFVNEWAARATAEEQRAVLADRPRIPPLLDAELLRAAASSLGSMSEEERKITRRSFWDRLAALAPISASAAASQPIAHETQRPAD